MFQGLTEQQKESLEKQWAQQKEQFLGRQKSMYDLHFRGADLGALKKLSVFPRYVQVYAYWWKTLEYFF